MTDDARAVTAVVLGGGLTGLAVLRELGRAGVPVLATADGDDLVTASKVLSPARTMALGDARDLETIVDSELAGYFLKPCDSQAFSARFGLKGFSIADRRHANVSIERATREGLSLLAQEVIPGPTTNHVFLDGYVARDGTFAALLARRRLRMFPLDFGNSTMTVSIPLSEAEGASQRMR